MKIIHTADWHLGNRMREQRRDTEQGAFLEWLSELMKEEKPDALLICGDVFDTGTPGEGTREMYNRFLSRADTTGCRHIIITGGNHDSVAQLESVGSFLERCHCTLVSHLTPDDEAIRACCIPIGDGNGGTLGMVCAVPFLRVAEVSVSTDQKDSEGYSLSYRLGVKEIYEKVAEVAKAWKAEHPGLPVVATGHLPVAGAERTRSTRSIAVGTVEVVDASVFSDVFDYVALGHIHKASDPEGGRILYSGSPLPMGVDEGDYNHVVFVAETGAELKVRAVPVPQSIRYEKRYCETREALDRTLTELRAACTGDSRSLWLEVGYAGGDMAQEELREYVRGALPSKSVIFPVRTSSDHSVQLSSDSGSVELTSYTPEIIFERCLSEYRSLHSDFTDVQGRQMKELFLKVLAES